MTLPDHHFRTARLEFVAATLRHLDAELEGNAALAALLDADVPPGWPPGEYDRAAMKFLRGRLAEGGEAAVGWYGWHIMRAGDSGRRDLVAAAGYFGPPSEGAVEVGYSVVPSAQGQGYATEVVAALTERALRTPGVERVIAHTTDANPASIRVLGKAGFARVGPGSEPGIVRYERRATR